jgi:putative transposase
MSENAALLLHDLPDLRICRGCGAHSMKQQLTYKFRLRDKHAAELNRQARAVNFVWNYCNEAQRHALRWDRWFSAFDLQKLTAGACKNLDINGHTVKRVCCQYVESRKRHRKPWLRWRGRKSLGWVPFNTDSIRFDGDAFIFRGVRYETMHLRDMPVGKIGAGSFNQDSRGRWYINCPVEVECADRAPVTRVGIDLGLIDLATLSTGDKIEMPRFYRNSELRLASVQRARKTPKRIRAIHAKVANRRKDFLHKASTALANQYGLIVVGDVSPSKLAKSRMAKSVLDAGWADLKRMLSYKSIRNGGSTLEVSEAHTTRTCAECGSIAGPKGQAGLNKRMWRCDCGAVHDRDVNAARNILARGLASLVEGAPAFRLGSSHCGCTDLARLAGAAS